MSKIIVNSTYDNNHQIETKPTKDSVIFIRDIRNQTCFPRKENIVLLTSLLGLIDVNDYYADFLH